jgi:peptidoglycan LD-endopeptidase CwlK
MQSLLDPHGLLKDVEPDLVRVVYAASQSQPFEVIAGLRTKAQEAGHVADGSSETMHSRHLADRNGKAAAIDVAALVDGHIAWVPIQLYRTIAANMQAAADDLHIPLQWGGDWISLKDFGHFQLPWAQYP